MSLIERLDNIRSNSERNNRLLSEEILKALGYQEKTVPMDSCLHQLGKPSNPRRRYPDGFVGG